MSSRSGVDVDTTTTTSSSDNTTNDTSNNNTDTTNTNSSNTPIADGGYGGSIEQRVLAASPIVEAFGNAKTVRNNNSSRFGKLVTVNFEATGIITGAKLINYLLEKSRVVKLSEGERTYHVFYQLLAGAEEDRGLRALLKLDGAQMYKYTAQGGSTEIEGVGDGSNFQDMRRAMYTLGISREEQLNLWRIVAGVLHYGNLRFEKCVKGQEEDASVIVNKDDLITACNVWGVDVDSMERSLVSRNIGTRSIVIVSYTTDQAKDARDAMCKRTYALLFDYIIQRINKSLEDGGGDMPHVANRIGVLDIFGFEM